MIDTQIARNNTLFGKKIKTATLRNGVPILLRYPEESDVQGMLDLINAISTEDTFITFSGEQLSFDEEKAYFDQVARDIESFNMVKILAIHAGKIVGNADVSRDKSGRRRSHHVGSFGITIAKEFRGVGLGELMMQTIIEEAKKEIPGLRIVKLAVYGENHTAQKLYTKMGFKEFGRLQEGAWYRGRYIEEIGMYTEV